jgi:hypothetical protein
MSPLAFVVLGLLLTYWLGVLTGWKFAGSPFRSRKYPIRVRTLAYPLTHEEAGAIGRRLIDGDGPVDVDEVQQLVDTVILLEHSLDRERRR